MTPKNSSLFGSTLFAKLSQEIGMVLFDVGSRGEPLPDFLPIAEHTTVIGFEPDKTECDSLNHIASKPSRSWKSETHFPVALGARTDNLDLQICRQPGCSSILEPSLVIPREFGRESDFEVTEKIPLPVEPLDIFCEREKLDDVDFLKVDVQGGELGVLQGGEGILGNRLLGLRAEVEFSPLYNQQPLFSEIELYLRQFGFYPADWLFQRFWRHNPKQEHAEYSKGDIPYSRGRLIHSDVLFLRGQQWIIENMPDANVKLCRLTIIALLYQQIDLAAKLAARIEPNDILNKVEEDEWIRELGKISKHLHRALKKQRFNALKRRVWHKFKG